VNSVWTLGTGVGVVGSTPWPRRRGATRSAAAAGRLHQLKLRPTRPTRSPGRPVVLARSRRAKTDVADVTRDGIRLIVAFVNDFHIRGV